MNEQHADEFWTRYFDDALTARERAALKQSLSVRPDRRRSFIDDLELDGVLRMLRHIDATEDDFVSRVAGALDEDEQAVTEFPLTTEAVESADRPDWPRSVRRVVPPPVPPPIAPESLAKEARSISEVDVANGPSLANRVQPQKHTLAHAISVVALILVGLVIAINIVANHEGDRVAGEKNKKRSPASASGKRETKRDEIVIDQPGSRLDEEPHPQVVTPSNVANGPVPQVVEKPAPRPHERGVAEIERNELPGKPSKDGPPPTKSVEPPKENSEIVARLTKSLRAVWEFEPQYEITSDPLYLESGIVEITMNDGVVLTVLGPSDFQLESTGCVLLSNGRLNALVPRQAAGFTVETPSSHVVDLGTEFDVSVDPDGETAVRVHQGEVELASLTSTDAEPKKWKLNEGQFKSLQRDGSSHDFYLQSNLDRSGRGTVHVNGIQCAVIERKDFDAARRKVNEELAQFRTDFVNRRGATFRGAMNLDGRQIRFGNSTQFESASRQANSYFDEVQQLLARVGSFSGSININGAEIKFDNMQDLLNRSEWIKRMGVSAPEGGFGNLRELMKMQEEMMGRLRKDGATSGGGDKADMRGSVNVDGKPIDFGNLEELFRLRDGLRGGSGLGGDDRPSRIEEMRRRHEEIRKRNRERLQRPLPSEPSHDHGAKDSDTVPRKPAVNLRRGD